MAQATKVYQTVTRYDQISTKYKIIFIKFIKYIHSLWQDKKHIQQQNLTNGAGMNDRTAGSADQDIIAAVIRTQ